MRYKYITGAALAWSMLIGCGDDDEDDAKAKCLAYIRAGCEFLAECGFIDESDVNACADGFMTQGRTCDDAVRVSSSYDECMDDLMDDDQCTDDGQLPESCVQVITLE